MIPSSTAASSLPFSFSYMADPIPAANPITWKTIATKACLVFLRIVLEIILLALSLLIIPVAACFKKHIISKWIVPAAQDAEIFKNQITPEEMGELRQLRASSDEQIPAMTKRIDILERKFACSNHVDQLGSVREHLIGESEGKSIQINTDDNLTLDGIFFRGSDFSNIAVIFMHGNGARYEHASAHIDFYRSLGVSVLVYNRRGVGISQGFPTSATAVANDGRAALKHLVEKERINPHKVIVSGISMGGHDTMSIVSAADKLYQAKLPAINAVSFSSGPAACNALLDIAIDPVGDRPWIPKLAIKVIALGVIYLIGWGNANNKRAFDRAGNDCLIIRGKTDFVIPEQGSLLEAIFKDSAYQQDISKAHRFSRTTTGIITDLARPERKITYMETPDGHNDILAQGNYSEDEYNHMHEYIAYRRAQILDPSPENPCDVSDFTEKNQQLQIVVDFFFDHIQKMRQG